MAPKDDPKLVIYVAVQQPKLIAIMNGPIPVSMIFNTVMKNSLQYLNIKPTTFDKAETNLLTDVTNMAVEEAVEALTKKGLKPVVIGKGNKVIQQLPVSNQNVLEGERVIVKADGDVVLPDLTGWSRRDVMKIANIINVKLTLNGNGYAVSQNIKAGEKIKQGSFLIVQCKPPVEQDVKKKQKADKPDAEKEADETSGSTNATEVKD